MDHDAIKPPLKMTTVHPTYSIYHCSFVWFIFQKYISHLSPKFQQGKVKAKGMVRYFVLNDVW